MTLLNATTNEFESLLKIFIETPYDTEHLKQHGEMMEFIKRSGTLYKLETFKKNLSNQALFLHNFMTMIEGLLLFIRASRQCLWSLHLYSLDNFVKYFFAHDQLNYAHMAPVYLAKMGELESKDEVTWNYLKQNFSTNKTSIPFVAIGSDHAMEQENKAMNVLGGMTGLTQQTSTLNRFCLTAPLLSNLSQLRNNIARYNCSYHYQLTGSTNDRIHKNKSKLISLLDSFSVSFASSENVANLVSTAGLPVTTADDLLNYKEIGLEMYKDFIINRINGPISLWSPMKKRNLKTFKVQVNTIKK